MKLRFLFLLTFLIFSFGTTSYALDTSGCTPLLEIPQKQSTFLNGNLEVILTKPNRADCWNADQSGIRINYTWISWVQIDENFDHIQSAFWIKANGNESLINAQTNCQLRTHGQASQYLTCRSSAYLRMAAMQKIQLEIAPVRDGVWDTKGFQKNYYFTF